MKKFEDLKQGDELFYVPSDSRHGDPSLKTVTKVGRKFVYLNGMKISPWDYNGYAIAYAFEWPHGEVYASEQDYLEMQDWQKFIQSDYKKLDRAQRKALLDLVKTFEGGSL